MIDLTVVQLSGEGLKEFLASYNAVITKLPPDLAKRLCAILQSYGAKYGADGAYKRLGGRTLSEVLNQFAPVDVTPMASGEVDGVKYRLYEAPPDDER